MTDTALTTLVLSDAAGGVDGATEPDGAEDRPERLPVLDILRGVAILGILFMNISDMGGSLYAFFSGDVRALGWTPADQVAWWAREVLANGTARCLLELLFGAGMAILTDRAATRMSGGRVLRGYAWRNIVLVGFGLLHVFVLLWPGDILHSYGLAALVAVGFRNLRPRLLITIGLSLATLQLVGGGTYVVTATWRAEAVAAAQVKRAHGQPLTAPERKALTDHAKREGERAKDDAESAGKVAAENTARTGTALTWAQALWGVFLDFERSGVEVFVVWEAAATMLIGVALYRLGVLQGGRSRSFYARMTAAAYLLGLSLRAWGAWAQTRFTHEPSASIMFGEYARLLTTLGHVGLINLLVMSTRGRRWAMPFAAAGRTALTIYICQSLIGLWMLYPPWGLALYGRQGWAALMLTAFAVDAALLMLAIWWVRRFRIAPVEWAWRSIIAGRALPFARRVSKGELLSSTVQQSVTEPRG